MLGCVLGYVSVCYMVCIIGGGVLEGVSECLSNLPVQVDRLLLRARPLPPKPPASVLLDQVRGCVRVIVRGW